MERATGMMLEIDDTDNPEKESFRRDPSGRFGRREAGCERVTRVLVANEPRSYRQAIAAALQVIRPDMEVLVVEPELLDDEVEERPEHERAEEPRQRGRRLLATPHLLRVDNGEAHAFHKEVDERPGDDNHTQARRRRESPSVSPRHPGRFPRSRTTRRAPPARSPQHHVLAEHATHLRGSIPGADGGSLPSPTRLRLPDHKTTNFA